MPAEQAKTSPETLLQLKNGTDIIKQVVRDQDRDEDGSQHVLLTLPRRLKLSYVFDPLEAVGTFSITNSYDDSYLQLNFTYERRELRVMSIDSRSKEADKRGYFWPEGKTHIKDPELIAWINRLMEQPHLHIAELENLLMY